MKRLLNFVEHAHMDRLAEAAESNALASFRKRKKKLEFTNETNSGSDYNRDEEMKGSRYS